MAPFVTQMVKNPPAMREIWVETIPWRRERLTTPVSGLENSTDCIVHGVAKSRTRLRTSLSLCLLNFTTDSTPARKGVWMHLLLFYKDDLVEEKKGKRVS